MLNLHEIVGHKQSGGEVKFYMPNIFGVSQKLEDGGSMGRGRSDVSKAVCFRRTWFAVYCTLPFLGSITHLDKVIG